MTKAIILLGSKGCGKSTLGPLLAKEYQCAFVDVDNVIQKMYGKTPKDIYNSKGITGFLFAEENACKKIVELAKGKNVIISTGGGICDNPPALERLQEESTLVYLDVDPSVVVDRILEKACAMNGGMMNNLPAYVPSEEKTSEEKVRKYLLNLYEQRNLQYRNIADITVDIKNASIKDSVSILKKALESN